MKKLWLVLGVVAASFLFSSPARADSASFGVRLGLWTIYPMIGIQAGYDFGSGSEGLGVRVVAESLLLWSRFGADVLYRFPLDTAGSNLYAGAGGGGILTAYIAAPQWNLGAHALVGYEAFISPGLSLFVEASPGAYFIGGLLSFNIFSGAGLNWHF